MGIINSRRKAKEKEKRCFEQDLCPKCNKRWSSGYTWPILGQKCKKCRIFVLPHYTVPLEDLRDEDDE
ncbi:unnamed protein product [Phaedon cochleariae]|uniref:Zinc finger domain-containing protein n=1 Tax=Phaedon cochleariae TaxID=80249 RepID=A0A9N9X1V2_PHACE|nr:unnamed protein product [Phaedon cochleariae]